MNLVIDQGNTICKLAFFEKRDEPLDVTTCPELDVPFLEELIGCWHPEACIFSSVKMLSPEITVFLEENIPCFLLLSSKTPLPIRNSYKTPQTLGLDRIAAAVGAWSLQPGKTLLVIDMGTAITYDLVREDGVYLGGNIAPGIHMRLKALNQFTDQLPLVEPESGFLQIGNDTQTAIRGGVMQGIIYEADGYFSDLQRKYSNLFAFLTGGDLFYFDGRLKNSIFACKNLVLIGLNRILQYNVHS